MPDRVTPERPRWGDFVRGIDEHLEWFLLVLPAVAVMSGAAAPVAMAEPAEPARSLEFVAETGAPR